MCPFARRQVDDALLVEQYVALMRAVGLRTGVIDGVRIDQRFDVAERDSNTVRIPVSFTYAGIGEAGRQLLNTGSINYRVAGGLTVATPLGNFTVPYDRTGRFSALGGSR